MLKGSSTRENEIVQRSSARQKEIAGRKLCYRLEKEMDERKLC